ncbi:EndoU domain-containing protein [Candidatus Poribacteria bacterium]|nr:EndoU domain-containing protein [Candidatus Poribacteria bacterium]
MNVKHIFHGEINLGGRAVGFHHRGGIGHQRRARIVQILDPPNAQGVYRAKVEVYDPKRGRWITKDRASTFFPDSWSRAQVLNQIRGAFQKRTFTRNSLWEGISPSSVTIRGYLDTAGNINTAYPLYQ